jgi:hypothetical protein
MDNLKPHYVLHNLPPLNFCCDCGTCIGFQHILTGKPTLF